jgi:hypothetical protein
MYNTKYIYHISLYTRTLNFQKQEKNEENKKEKMVKQPQTNNKEK